MKKHKSSTNASLSLVLLFLPLGAGCGPSLELVGNSFYDYDGLSTRLAQLHADYPDVISVQSIGKTYEGRSILAVKVTGNAPIQAHKPALMAIFTQHGDEHDTTDLGVGIAQYLAEKYGEDERVTELLRQKEVWLVPMMNPDGVEYDFSGSVKPFSWRKNRRRTGENTYGVDLNRNWGHKWEAPIPEDLAKDLNDKESLFYAGERPFSERETAAIRGFLLSHPNVRIFVDYHSGYAPFVQGGVGFPIPRSETDNLPQGHRERLERITEQLAARISNAEDKRTAFIVNKERDVAKTVKKHAPWYVKPLIPKSIPSAPGTSGEWVYGELGIMVVGVEILRNKDFFRRLPESKNELVESQVPGFLFLLDVLCEEPLGGHLGAGDMNPVRPNIASVSSGLVTSCPVDRATHHTGGAIRPTRQQACRPARRWGRPFGSLWRFGVRGRRASGGPGGSQAPRSRSWIPPRRLDRLADRGPLPGGWERRWARPARCESGRRIHHPGESKSG